MIKDLVEWVILIKPCGEMIVREKGTVVGADGGHAAYVTSRTGMISSETI